MGKKDLQFSPQYENTDIKRAGDYNNLRKAALALSFANYLSNYDEVATENLDKYFRKKIFAYQKKIEDGMSERSAKYRKAFVERMVNNAPLEFLSFIKFHGLNISTVVAPIGTSRKIEKTYSAQDQADFEDAEKKAFSRGMRYFTLKYIVKGKGISKEKQLVKEKEAKGIELLYHWNDYYEDSALNVLSDQLAHAGYIASEDDFKRLFSNCSIKKIEWLNAPQYALVYLINELEVQDSVSWISKRFLFKGKSLGKKKLIDSYSKYTRSYSLYAQSLLPISIKNIDKIIKRLKVKDKVNL